MKVSNSRAASAPCSQAGERRYVYCVIGADEPLTFAAPGVAGPEYPVHTINYRNLAAVVSEAPEESYESTRRNLTSHMRVLEEVMRERPILPMRFNSVSPSVEEVVTRVLTAGRDKLSAQLDSIAGRVEMGVKALWREDTLYREIAAENAGIRQLRDRISGRSPEATRRERVRLGEMVEKALLAKRERESGEMLARLSPLAEKVRLNEPVSERMALNAALFMKACNQTAFEQRLNELDSELSNRMTFKCVGPVPPYNFVELTIQ
jgi:hypothetical protein